MALGTGVNGLGDLGIDGMGGGMGIGDLGGRGSNEDEVKRRLDEVLGILSVSKGRLSAAGVERLAQRLGLDLMWQDNMRTNSKTLIIAGPAHVALDIDFVNDTVIKVALSFPDSPEIVTRYTEKAGDILLRDLKVGPKENRFTKVLDRFAANLQRLASLDKLSGNPGLNCHEAVARVYESLEKLHLWEVKKVQEEQAEMKGRDYGYMERLAMCTKSGKPVMHTRDRLGLSLDYWQNKRFITAKSLQHENEKTWALLVECAALPLAEMMVFPPLRASQDWISKKILKEDAQVDLFDLTQVQLDWLEPDATVVASKPDAMESVESSTQKVDVIFIAKFDPPLIVPFQLAMTIYNSTNAPFDMYHQSTFDGLMFPQNAAEILDGNSGSRSISSETTIKIPSKNGDEWRSRKHKNTLLIDKIGYGRTLTELPFSHPRQLVEMLPSLRQYAFLSSLLSKTFGAGTEPGPIKETPKDKLVSKQDEFEAFMTPPPPSSKPTIPSSGIGGGRKEAELKLDISLQIEPDKVRLRLVFPWRKRMADVTFLVKLNGVVEVESENLLVGNSVGVGNGKGKELRREDLGRVLEVCEDLGVWVEWVVRRLG
ncbi:mediator of RNA polymerase II transcription subunit 1-domain-containing protein [Amylocarpus encephaloides]|uniref:Mediator of RNA polymerase II transcription subunit 1 n=1 Tax=Amylocarpus encephaloides TaxID=45428 RepID=A0A9P8C762_9HELO|nr:mediator of RNA polymerase II transcription subunit 1-domain-containing protein [Amylocarpus encephaloides]